MKKLLMLCMAILLLTSAYQPVSAQSVPVRLKDIGKIVEARDNQLFGFGLVVGLRNTGDSKATGFTHLALRNMLGKMGVASGVDFNSRNVAAVMVTATLPPFIKPGQRIPVTVSALGDSSSLVGGTLLITALQGPDLQTYAVAQGPLIVSGFNERSTSSRFHRNQTTVGGIPDGGIVEREVAVTFSDQHNITIVLENPNFITITRAVKAIQDSGFPGAKAIDASTVKIPLSDLDSSDLVATIAELENITLVPDASSKIVVNARTGTVVIGEMVRLYPVALTHGSLSIRISDQEQNALSQAVQENAIQIEEDDSKLIYLNPTATLSSLVNALNEIGATPKDLIAIIRALKESGALIADVDVI